MPQEDLTAARVSLVLDGEEYLLDRITDQDISELDEWVRGNVMRIARASLSGPDDPFFEKTMDLALGKASRTSWMTGDGAKMMATPDGLARIVWQAAHRNHPGLEWQQLRTKMFNVESISDTVNALKKVRPSVPAGSKTGGGATPKKSRRKQSSTAV